MSATDWLWLVFVTLPAAFVLDLFIAGLLATWWYFKRTRGEKT